MPSILVVDDSGADRILAGRLLEKHGHTVRFAVDGKEALAQMEPTQPDLVLTDLQMPEMNGLELAGALKREYPFVPVILMTAQGSEDIAAEALRLGAASYVPKRNLAAALAGTVERVLLGSSEDRGHSQLMHYLDAGECRFALRNDLGLIKTLVNHLQQMLRCLPLGDENERLRCGIALEEALTNAYCHGNLEVGRALGKTDRAACEQLAQERRFEEPYRNRRIFVTARIDRDRAEFVVRDEGPGFAAHEADAAASLLDAERGAGRGLTLMRAIMDEVTFNHVGNEVTMVKRRAASPDAEDAGDAGA